MQAAWQSDTEGADAVILADNKAGRGVSERIFESWTPGNMSQMLQEEGRVDSNEKFVQPRGNWGIAGTLVVSWAETDQSALMRAVGSLPGQLGGRGRLDVVFQGGARWMLSGACVRDIAFAADEMLEVRVRISFTFVAEWINVL